MENKKIGEHLSNLRKSNHMTQSELAKKLYVSNKTISKWESGKSLPSIEDIKRISKIFNISVDNILNYKSKKAKRKKYFLLSLVLILIIIALSIIILGIKNYYSTQIYSIGIANPKFFFENSYYSVNNKNKHLYLGNIKQYGEEVSNLSFVLFYDGNIVSKSLPYVVDNFEDINKFTISITYKDNNNKSVSDTYNLSLVKYFNKYITSYYEEGELLSKESSKIIKDGYKLYGNYYSKTVKEDNVITTYKIDLDSYICTETIEDNRYKIIYEYKYREQYLHSYIYLKDKLVNDYEYNASNGNIICNLGDCNDYQEVIFNMKGTFDYLLK